MEFQQLVRFRRSMRRFADRPVEKETLEKLVDAARYAPSAGNGQPWHFYAVQSAAMLSRLKREVYPAEWFAAVPAVIVVTLDRERAEPEVPAAWTGAVCFSGHLRRDAEHAAVRCRPGICGLLGGGV